MSLVVTLLAFNFACLFTAELFLTSSQKCKCKTITVKPGYIAELLATAAILAEKKVKEKQKISR